jgi:putative MATE family efflux protein
MAKTLGVSLREEIRKDDMWRLMAKLTPVAVLAMSINSINTFVDAVFVGQYLGENAVSAISLAFPLSFLSNAFAAMIGIGGSSLLSRAIGANDKETQKKIFGAAVVLAITVSLILTVLGYVFAESVIASIGGKGEVLRLGVLYYRAIVLGSFFQILAVSLNMIIRAEGNLKDAMTFAMIATISNIIMNPIFIGYFKMGIEGSAYATILSMIFSSVISISYFATRRASYEVDLTYYKFEAKLMRPIITVGISAMMLQLMFVIQQIVVFKMIDVYGDDWDRAFMGACYRVLILMLVPGFGFSSAMQPIAGINYGANDYARVKEAFWKFSLGSTMLTTVLLLIFLVFPNFVLGLMLPNVAFKAEDIYNFRLMMSPGFMFSFFFMGIVFFQAIGNAKVAGGVMLLRELVFFVP